MRHRPGALAVILRQGHDPRLDPGPVRQSGCAVLGRGALAETGSGKTSACGVPIVQSIDAKENTIQALVMVPTRELALQMQKDANLLGKYSGCKVAAVFGGMDYQKQKQLLAEKVIDIIAATPGRLLDFHHA